MTLSTSGISKRFGSVDVLSDISFQVPRGSRAALVGPSGSGKTTLLRLIAGFEQPDAGEIRLGDRVIAGAGESVPAHRRGIGYVPQDGALFPHLTVRGNIGFGLRRADRAVRVDEVMRLVDLDPSFATRFPHQLSGGQQQRVALARALAPGPRVILLDEPFSALDTGLREQTRAGVVAVLEEAGVTTVLVTHDQREALSFGQAIGVLAAGRLAHWGDPASVFDDPATPEVATFLGPAVLLPARRVGGDVQCLLGRLPIRHDRAAGSPRLVAMIRPAQLALRSGGVDAVIHDIRGSGAYADVSVWIEDAGWIGDAGRIGDAGSIGGARSIADSAVSAVSLTVPAHELGNLRPGDRIGVVATGGVVTYAAG